MMHCHLEQRTALLNGDGDLQGGANIVHEHYIVMAWTLAGVVYRLSGVLHSSLYHDCTHHTVTWSGRGSQAFWSPPRLKVCLVCIVGGKRLPFI